MVNIYDLSYEKLEEKLLSLGEKKFRCSQIWDWLYIKRVTNFNDMSNLSKDTINKLNNNFSFDYIDILRKQESDLTNKYLFRLIDGNFIEAVLMKHDYGYSVCVSSQVGCNMGCRFCESGRRKKVRNLTPSEMVLQIMQVEDDIKERISHVVIMGIGEPFDNYDNVVSFIKIVNHAKGIALGSRHITISTCGIIPKIREFSELPFQVNLAISLHAPNNEIRNKIMPINKVYPIKKLINEIKLYIKKTNRRVTFEYIMLSGINDDDKCANELCDLLKGINCYINLIPYNETNNFGYKRSKKDDILKFYDIIKSRGLNVTIRKEFGTKISAACGQLRSQEEL